MNLSSRIASTLPARALIALVVSLGAACADIDNAADCDKICDRDRACVDSAYNTGTFHPLGLWVHPLALAVISVAINLIRGRNPVA